MEMVVTLLVVGTILLISETVLPGAIAGILGLLCLLAGVVAAYYEFGPRTGNLVLIGVSLGLCGGIALWVRVFPTSRTSSLNKAFRGSTTFNFIVSGSPPTL